MRVALIDNSTLTAVQRILGEIPIKYANVLDGDIVCLESLIRTILFFDEIYYIDDYKEEYRRSRNDFFHMMTPLDMEPSAYEQLCTTAAEQQGKAFPIVQGGEVVDEHFKSLLETLKMNVNFNWRLASSNWFLTMCMLTSQKDTEATVEKFGTLSGMIFSELMGSSRTKAGHFHVRDYQLLSRGGEDVSSESYKVPPKFNERMRDHSISSKVFAFLDSLNWLSYRSLVYLFAAPTIGANLVLHPVRSAFVCNYLRKESLVDHDFSNNLLDLLSKDSFEAVEKLYHNDQGRIIAKELPFFTAWMASEGVTPSDFLNRALELREERPFVDARQRLFEMEEIELIRPELQKRSRDFESLRGDLLSDYEDILLAYGVSGTQGKIQSPAIDVTQFGGTIFGFFKMLPMSVLRQIMVRTGIDDIIPRRGLRAVFRSITYDLSAVSKFGILHSKITEDVQRTEDSLSTRVQQEEEQFRFYKSDWKRPM